MDVDRRTFLKSGAAAGLLPLNGCRPPAATTTPPPFELDEATIDQLQERLRSGKDSARSLAERYLDRIHALDKQGPALNAVIELNPDAAAIADSLDAERKQKGPRGPLHGIPILVKDNLDTADKMKTTAGSLALADSIAAKDSYVVERLRAAGVVLLGKTNLSEWANMRSTHSTSGWSGRGGQTRNPYALDRNPCGSSSGSGAAVAANFCTAAIGTETDGSIVCPSSVNGIVGIKPTVGLVGRSGIIPIAHSQDTAGPMARTVRDAAILLTAIAAVDPRDPATRAAQAHLQPDYTKFLDANGLRGARIGIARKYFGNNDVLNGLLSECVEAMKKAGAQIVDPADLPSHGKPGWEVETDVLLYEYKTDLNAFLAGLGPPAKVHSLPELIAFNQQHAKEEMPYFGQELLAMAEKKGPLTDKEYVEIHAKLLQLARADGIDGALAKFKVDAMVALTAGTACLIDHVNGDQDTGGCSTPAAVAGYPHITVPASYIRGLPVGLSFFGTAWSEPVLLKLAYAFEQATKTRQSPKFLPSAMV